MDANERKILEDAGVLCPTVVTNAVHFPDEQSISVNFPPVQYQIIKQIDLTQDSIERIAGAVVRKLKAEEGE